MAGSDSPATRKPIAAPGRIAWLMASPIRLMRRSIRNTPIGGAPSDSARQPTSARRMKANSMKGWVTASIMPAAARERLRPASQISACSSNASTNCRDFSEIGGRQHFARLAPGHHLARDQQRHGEMRAHLLHVMQRGEHGASLAVPAQDQRDEIGDGLGVDGAERLIEQDERGILQQQAREQHALELAARQRADRTVPEVLQADGGERAGDLRVARGVEAAPGADLAPQPHRHAVEHRDGKAAVDVDLLRQVGDVGLGQPVEIDAAAERLELAHDALEQRRFAGAVGPDDGEQLAARHLAGDVMHGGMPVIAEREIAKRDGRLFVLHAHANAQNTAPQSSAEAIATIKSRAGTERRSSEMPLAGELGAAAAACACGAAASPSVATSATCR